MKLVLRAVAILVILIWSGLPEPISAAAAEREFPHQEFADDVDWLINQIRERYAYLDEGLRFPEGLHNTVFSAKAARNEEEFIGILEFLLVFFADHHVTLGTNTNKSPQLIPSGTDIWATFVEDRPTIDSVRLGSVAWDAGLRPGMVVPKIGDFPEDLSLDPPRYSMSFREHLLRVRLAGSRVSPRRITACRGAKCQEYAMDAVRSLATNELVNFRTIDGDIGHLRIENSLGDSAAIAAFDNALSKLADTNALVLDLRNTPSGGNTDVAEPIMGRFIDKEAPYQRVFVPGPGKTFDKDSWLKTVKPRGETVTKPMVVLVDRWTGSMGEGMAIGFDALGRAKIVGTRMAGLLGGIGDFKLPRTGIVVKFPIERLYHVNGTPREDFVPPVLTRPPERDGEDPALEAGLALLRKATEHKDIE
jgi:carboxyl-terminal processing protease